MQRSTFIHLSVQRSCLTSFVALALVIGGCGADDSGHVPVSGTVTYQGQPVAGAQVAFRGDGAATPSVGVTDDTGSFTLMTGKFVGATPGEHIVTVVKLDATDGVSTAEVSMEDAGREGVIVDARHELPTKYATAAESDLRRNVSPDGDNHFDIELTD